MVFLPSSLKSSCNWLLICTLHRALLVSCLTFFTLFFAGKGVGEPSANREPSAWQSSANREPSAWQSSHLPSEYPIIHQHKRSWDKIAAKPSITSASPTSIESNRFSAWDPMDQLLAGAIGKARGRVLHRGTPSPAVMNAMIRRVEESSAQKLMIHVLYPSPFKERTEAMVASARVLQHPSISLFFQKLSSKTPPGACKQEAGAKLEVLIDREVFVVRGQENTSDLQLSSSNSFEAQKTFLQSFSSCLAKDNPFHMTPYAYSRLRHPKPRGIARRLPPTPKWQKRYAQKETAKPSSARDPGTTATDNLWHNPSESSHFTPDHHPFSWHDSTHPPTDNKRNMWYD